MKARTLFFVTASSRVGLESANLCVFANSVTGVGLQTTVFACMFHGLSFTLVQMKLLELQELVMRLVRERNEWYSKYVAAAQNPELLASQNEGVLAAERRIELNATDGAGKLQPGQGLCRGNSPCSQPWV